MVVSLIVRHRSFSTKAFFSQRLTQAANPILLSDAFSVVRVTPKCAATSVFVIWGSDNIAAALRISESDIVIFRR